MNRFTKYQGQWAVLMPVADHAAGKTVNVTRSNGEVQEVILGNVLHAFVGEDVVVVAFSNRKKVVFPKHVGAYRRYEQQQERDILFGKPQVLHPVLALLAQADAAVKQAALMDPAPPEQERQFFADLTESMKDFRKKRVTREAQSA